MADGPNYVDAIITRAREAAGAGLRSAWFSQSFGHDSPALAALVGREVPELQVGTSAIPIFGRHPLLISSQAQTTQAATHGRYHLGLALGHKPVVEEAFGIPYDRPIGLLREFLAALRSLLETGQADFRGKRVTAVTPFPATVAGAQPPVPLLVAALGPQSLRAAGELADGTLPHLVGPKTLSEQIVPAITSAAENAGRPAPRIIVSITGVVTADVDAVRQAAARELDLFGHLPSYRRVLDQEGVAHPADLAVIGDEDTIAAAVDRCFDSGATEVLFNRTHLGGDADRLRTWKILGELARSRSR